MPTTSSTYAGNDLQTRVEREPQQLDTGLDKLADYVSAYKPRQSAANQAAGLYSMPSFTPMGGGMGAAPRGPQVMREDAGGPGTSFVMDTRTGRWSNWVDPIAAEKYNTGRAVAGRSAFGPGQKDDWNISSLQYANPLGSQRG